MTALKKIASAIVIYVLIPGFVLNVLVLIGEENSSHIATALSFVGKQLPEEIQKPLRKLAGRRVEEKNYSTAETAANEKRKAREVLITDVINSKDIKKVLEQDDDINKIPLEFSDQSYTGDDIMRDKFSRLPEDFKIPRSLKPRVRFWFDIYTRYSSRFTVIHDVDQPWIIYRVVDLRGIYDGPGNIYKKDAKDRTTVANAKNEVRATLMKLSRRINFSNLTAEEQKYVKLLEGIKGNRRKVYMKAAQNIRDQRGQKNFFRKGLISGSKYINEMEEIFARYDLPVELTRLPLVESSFNEDAQSKVGASGIWQFMPDMGKKYLKVSNQFDERNSPIKATEAAAQLMLSNFRILRSWPLAVTAYNHGAGGLIKASKRLQSKNLDDIIKSHKSKSFGFASQNFYSEFLAALYAEKYHPEIFGEIGKHAPLVAETIDLRYNMRAQTLIDILGMTMEELKLYNPELKSQTITGSTYLPAGFHIRLPKERRLKLDDYNQNQKAEADPTSS